MPRREPQPRVVRFWGMAEGPVRFEKGTWIESEMACYPHGGMTRRARALCPDGKLRVFRCGLPDTFFSIPVKGGGWLGMGKGEDERVLVYHPKEGEGKGEKG